MSLSRKIRYQLREPVTRGLVRLFARLSLPTNHLLASMIGNAAAYLPGSFKRTCETNLRLCFPEKSSAEQTLLLRRALRETAKSLTEVGPLWLWEKQRVLDLIKGTTGEHHLDDAIKKGKGVILLAPHIGAWEVIGIYVSSKHAMTTLYRPHPIKALTELMLQGRRRLGGALAPTDASGVRVLFKALKENHVVGILPDQDPGKEGGLYAPLFGRTANTMTLLSKLAMKSGATVLGVFAERLAKGAGYHIHFSAPLDEINNPDLNASVSALNQEIERMIRLCPEQYQWGYQRFKRQPDGSNPYR